MTNAASPVPIDLTIDPAIRAIVRLGLVRAQPVLTAPSSARLSAELDDLAAEYRRRYAGRSPAEIAPLADARELYRAFGIDPTRTRPSSEALLRRALKGDPLPRISNAVDLCNLCSLRFLLPIGLYDASKIVPPVRLRRGRPGESYRGIRKDDVHLEGRPVLEDVEGPFGNPTSDSWRTSVDGGTASLWMVIFAPASYSGERMHDNVRIARGSMERHLAPADGTVSTSGEP